MTVCIKVNTVGATRMNTMKFNCWPKLDKKFAMTPQEAESNYRNIRTGYGVDDTSERKNLFRGAVSGIRELSNWSCFQFL